MLQTHCMLVNATQLKSPHEKLQMFSMNVFLHFYDVALVKRAFMTSEIVAGDKLLYNFTFSVSSCSTVVLD